MPRLHALYLNFIGQFFMTDNGFYFGQFEKNYFFLQVAELEDRFLRSVGEKGGLKSPPFSDL
jgi:hypothetical protein